MREAAVQDFGAFLEALASDLPVPGGGSVAAYEVAMGAALVAMVANLTLGRKRYEDVRERAIAVRDRARALCDQARSLSDADIEAYGRVAEAMALARVTDEEKSIRRERMQAALKAAVVPPLQTMRTALEVMSLARDLVDFGNVSAISDVGCAALATRAGYHAGRLNVEINLASIKDEDWVREFGKQVSGLSDPDRLEREIMERVEAIIHSQHV
jgi:formiminotetrahydrofolate cyclodeaminase